MIPGSWGRRVIAICQVFGEFRLNEFERKNEKTKGQVNPKTETHWPTTSPIPDKPSVTGGVWTVTVCVDAHGVEDLGPHPRATVLTRGVGAEE